MKLITSRGHEYNVHFVDVVFGNESEMMLRLDDARRLPVIAEEFDGLECLKRESKDQGNKEFEGYNELKSITRVGNGAVLIALTKGE